MTFDLGKRKEKDPAAEQWALGSTKLADQVMFYKLGDHLLSRFGSAGSSSLITERAAKAGNLRVAAIGRDVWGIWTDPGSGLMLRRLR